MAKSFPAVLGSEESNHETSVIDVTGTKAPRTSETGIETSGPDPTKSILLNHARVENHLEVNHGFLSALVVVKPGTTHAET